MTAVSRSLHLPNGHTLSYDEHGPSDGFPILFFHGTPASRMNWRFFDDGELVNALKLRVLAVDRPGHGQSSSQSARNHATWAHDVRVLLDALGLERVSVLAHSGGGPYALACALHMPERLHAVGLVAGSPPDFETPPGDGVSATSRQFLQMCAEKPRAARALLMTMRLMLRFAPKLMVRQAAQPLPPADLAVMADPAMERAFLDMMRVALRQGARGVQLDGALMYGPHQLPLERIRVPLQLWYGEQDRNVPPEVGKYFHERIPNSQLTLYPEDGHLSIMVRHARDILLALRPLPVGAL